MAGSPGSRSARVGQAFGYAAALVLTLGLVAGGGYLYANFDQVKEQLEAARAGAAGQEDARLGQAADSAIAYAEDLGRPPMSTGVGRGYRLSHPAPAGIDSPPGHWCPAGPIGYRIDFTTAVEAGATRDKEINRWQQAFEEWTEASGGRYQFEYRGPALYPVTGTSTAEYPIDPAAIPDGEIAITYGVPPGTASDRWNGYRHPTLATALGFAAVGPINWSSGPDQGVINRAMIVLDAVDSDTDPAAVPIPYIHEAGHALGLSHVEDPGQLMYATPGPDTVMNDGDREGIRRLAAQPCS